MVWERWKVESKKTKLKWKMRKRKKTQRGALEGGVGRSVSSSLQLQIGKEVSKGGVSLSSEPIASLM